MIKSFVNKFLKTALNELFINDNNENDISINLSIGSDIFSDSNINLKNLTIRSDIFDIYLQPITLLHGSIDSLKIEGIAELALGSKLRISIDNIYLLFSIDNNIDAERAQVLKKILLEMASNSLPQVLIFNILKKIQGFANTTAADSGGTSSDIKKKRRLIIRGLNYVLANISILIKNIHIRLETNAIEAPLDSNTDINNNNNTSDNQENSQGKLYVCSSIGIIIPQVKILPNSKTKNDKDNAPQFSVKLVNYQVYCDYNCDSYLSTYTSNLATKQTIYTNFKNKYVSEIHTAILLPTNIEVSLQIEIRKKTGLLYSKFNILIDKINLSIDEKQLEVLTQLLDELIHCSKKLNNCLKVRGIFGRRWLPPRISEIGGIKILPNLLIGEKRYPTFGSIPRLVTNNKSSNNSLNISSSTSIIYLLKSRLGPNWGKAIWRHVIRLTISDIRRNKPLGRWIDLIKLIWMRKQYSFMYSKLIKKSKESGNYYFNISQKIDISLLLKLFDLEMLVPVNTLCIFRSLGIMISYTELMNKKRKQISQGTVKSPVGLGSFVNINSVNISWRDILRIHSEIIEGQRLSAFHRAERVRSTIDIDDSMTDVGDSNDLDSLLESDHDDVMSTYSVSTNNTSNITTTPTKTTNPNLFTPSTSNKPSKQIPTTSSAIPNSISHTMRSSARAVVSLQSTAMKMIGNALTGGVMNSGDELDNKVFSRAELTAFAEWLTGLESEKSVDASQYISIPTSNGQQTANRPAIQTEITLTLTDIKSELNDYSMGGAPPSHSLIAESVHWELNKVVPAFTFIPPDFILSISEISFNIRYPLIDKTSRRLNHLTIVLSNVNTNISISPSTHLNNNITNNLTNNLTNNQIDSLRGFVTLLGCLIQVRLTGESLFIYLSNNNINLFKLLSGEKMFSLTNEVIPDITTNNTSATLSPDRDANLNELLDIYQPSYLSTSLSSDKQIDLSNHKVCILQTNEKETFFILCLLLDYDFKGEGAADVQGQLGDVSIDLSVGALSSLLDDKAIQYLYTLSALYSSLAQLLKEYHNKNHFRNVVSESLHLFVDMKNALLADERKRLLAKLSNRPSIKLLNCQHWRSVLEYVMPTVLSMCLRTSKIKADVLTASLIRNIIVSLFQEMSDSASRNRTSIDEDVFYDESYDEQVKRLPGLFGQLQTLRRRALKSNADKYNESTSQLTILPIEIVVNKSTNPNQAIKLIGFGIEIYLPIQDDSLVQALALVLSDYFPVYM